MEGLLNTSFALELAITLKYVALLAASSSASTTREKEATDEKDLCGMKLTRSQAKDGLGIIVFSLFLVLFVLVSVSVAPSNSSKHPLEMSRSEHLNMYQRYVVTWTMPYPSWADPLVGEWRSRLYRQVKGGLQVQLTNPSGWERAGIGFLYTPSIADANIVFHATSSTQISSICEDKESVACEEYASGGRCGINLGYEIKYVRSNAWDYANAETGTVNHEMGHCFGFNHTRHGLMNPESPVEFPSAQLIRFVQHEIGHSNEAFGSGHAK